MYGQTGSGKTFTMMGPRNEIEAQSATLQLTQGKNSLSSKTPSVPKLNSAEIDKTPRYGRTKSLTVLQKNPKPSSCNREFPSLSGEKQLRAITPPNSEKFQTPVALMSHKEKQQPLTSDVNANGGSFDGLKNNPENETGILILSLKDVFEEIEKDTTKKYFLKCSYLEIYNDLVYDLLNQTNKLDETLSISEDHNREFVIKGAVEEIVTSYTEILEKIQRGERKIYVTVKIS